MEILLPESLQIFVVAVAIRLFLSLFFFHTVTIPSGRAVSSFSDGFAAATLLMMIPVSGR